MVGRTRMIRPMKPAAIPAEFNLVGIFLKNINTKIATQICIVELISAEALEDYNEEYGRKYPAIP